MIEPEGGQEATLNNVVFDDGFCSGAGEGNTESGLAKAAYEQKVDRRIAGSQGGSIGRPETSNGPR